MQSPGGFVNNWFYDVYFVQLDESMSVMRCDLMSHISYIYWNDEDDDADIMTESGRVLQWQQWISCRYAFGQVILHNDNFQIFFLDIQE